MAFRKTSNNKVSGNTIAGLTSGAAVATLKQTITTTGAVTIPAGVGIVYAIIGSSPTSATAEGWVPADTAFSLTNGVYYYSCLSSTTGPNLYLYY